MKGGEKYMKKIWLCAFSLIAVMMLFTSCDKSNNPMAVDNPTVDGPALLITPPAGSFKTDIMAGQNDPGDIGDINVWFDANNMYVLYQTKVTPWYLTEFHVDVQLSPDDFPTHNGNPAPGQFAYKGTIDTKTEYLVIIPLKPWMKSATQLAVAAHCVVVKLVDGQIVQEETGWGKGNDFPGSNWAMWFWVQVHKSLYLPTYPVKAKFTASFPGTSTPYPFQVWNVGEGYSIPNSGTYPSFCLDEKVYITPGTIYNMILRTTYDYTMPDYCRYGRYPNGQINYNLLVEYDRINYILNHYWPITPMVPPYTFSDLQTVYWYYRGWRTYASLSARQKLIADDGNNNGDGFWPSTGQWMAVLLDNSVNTQLIFIIVDP